MTLLNSLFCLGWYTTITLAVYGTITKSITEQVGSGPGSVAEAAPPPAPVTTPPATTNTTQPWPDLAQNPDVYPATNYPQDNYDQPGNYQPEYYNQDAPKDPRAYHHPVDGSNNIWDDKERPDIVRDRDRDIVHPRDKERNRHGSVGRDVLRLRSRSNERTRSRERNSPRYSRSRSRERDYSAIRSSTKDDNFRRENSRSPGYRDRERPLSRDKDWDRSYKREDYRRHRQPSYDRSRGGSYENKRGSPSYDKRAPSYERRPPSYENRASSFEKHLPAYEKRAPSYEKRSYDKRAPSYDRMREASYDSRSHSPTREDPRKRPRTPPIEISRRPHTPLEINNPHDRDNLSPVDSVLSEDEYDHNKRNDELYLKKPKSRKIHIKSEADLKAHPPVPKDISTYDASIVKTESQSPQNIKIGTPLDSPCPPQEDVSMDTEPFEPILSDEEICDDMEGPFADMDYDVADYCAIDDSLKCFNPFRAEWQTYAPFHKSSLYLPVDDTVHKHVMNTSLADLCSMNKHFLKLYEIVVDLKNEKYSYSNFAQLTADDKEEWVQTCEKLPSLLTNISNESDILYRIFKTVNIKDHLNDDFRSILDSLLNFCRIGLDYDLALSHIQAIFKIKHIKCGIRLIESLSANKHNEIIVMTLLDDNIDVYSKLLEIYSKNHMALSIKLLTLKSLDACLGSEATIEHFLTERFYNIFDDSSITTDHKSDLKVKPITKQLLKNGYQILIIMLSKNPLSRVKFAINALINKLNLFELLKRLHESVEQLNAKENTGQIISENEIELIINSLEEILCIYRNGSFEMSQPRRFLPVSVQFDVKRNCTNNVLIEFFNIHKLLETCLYLLTCPLTYNYPVITNPIYEVLVHLVNSHEGLMYLLENIKATVLVFQTLIQPYNQQNDEDHLMVLQDVNNCTSLQQLGLEMAYKLQALYYIHTISDLQNGNDIDESELFDKLQGLYCLGFGNVGKLALASVLGMGDNIECLLNLYENDIHNKSTEMDDNIVAKKKSPTKNYAVDLTVCTIQFNPDVNFLKKYGRRILTVAKEFDLFEQSIASNLQEVLPYLKPLEKPKIFSNENISDIVEVIKGSIEHVTSAPGDLATSLRILKHLGISEFETKRMPLGETPKLEYTELKYKYVILQLFSLDGVSLIVNILEKICAHFEQPSLHTATFVSVHGLHLTNIILPSLELLNKMLTYVIQCRNTQYKDLTSVPIVLQTYNLMYSYPVSAVGYKMAQKACKECIEILLAHTQPIAEDPLENELIHKSLWTLLCSEVIKYILTGPYTYIPGLLVFSEILPLPLPIQTKYALTESELSKMVSNRKLWSAHLHTLSSNISEMIQSICFSVCQPVVQLLRRLCIQLTDLASNMALCITRSVLDLLISNVCNESNSLPQPMTPVGYNVARILNFLACLITHPSVKCTTLHLLRQGTSLPKSEDRYSIFIPLLCSILTTVSDNQSHVQSQECVISIISSFYDSEITLLTQFDSVPSIKMEVTDESSENTKPVMTPEIYLANAIPSKDILISLINASLEYLANENSIPSIILSVLRTFFLLTEHDYGFYYFKYCIEKNKTVMPQLFNRLVNGINKDSPECLSTFMELLRVLQSNAEDIEATEGLQFIPRTSTLSIHDIAEIIGWHKNKEHHPILTLEKFLKVIIIVQIPHIYLDFSHFQISLKILFHRI